MNWYELTVNFTVNIPYPTVMQVLIWFGLGVVSSAILFVINRTYNRRRYYRMTLKEESKLWRVYLIIALTFPAPLVGIYFAIARREK